MKSRNSFLEPIIPYEKQALLEDYLFKENIQRCKLFAKIVILFESILIVMNMFETYRVKNILIDFNIYFILYSILILMSLLMFFMIRWFEGKQNYTEKQYKRMRIGLLILVSLYLIWGAVVTLVDQKEYGHVMAFVVNFLCVSILFHATNRIILAIFAPAIIVLVIGLPLFQPSTTVLMGHFINLAAFLFFCWLASRMLYKSHATNFISKLLLTEANENLAQKIKENERMNEKLRQLSILDELTNIPNRRGFQQYIHEELARKEQERKISLLMVDIDAFKPYNDNYGHPKGDKVIQAVAQVLKNIVVFPSSISARFGGEEFIVAVFDIDQVEAQLLAEKIRKSVEDLRIIHEYSPVSNYVTICVGEVTGRIVDESQLFQLIEQADFALYHAKDMGRNQVGTVAYQA